MKILLYYISLLFLVPNSYAMLPLYKKVAWIPTAGIKIMQRYNHQNIPAIPKTCSLLLEETTNQVIQDTAQILTTLPSKDTIALHMSNYLKTRNQNFYACPNYILWLTESFIAEWTLRKLGNNSKFNNFLKPYSSDTVATYLQKGNYTDSLQKLSNKTDLSLEHVVISYNMIEASKHGSFKNFFQQNMKPCLKELSKHLPVINLLSEPLSSIKFLEGKGSRLDFANKLMYMDSKVSQSGSWSQKLRSATISIKVGKIDHTLKNKKS